MSSTLRLLVAAVIGVWSQVALADADLVGDIGDTDRIRFVGNQTFDTKLLHASLRYDPDITIASHPMAPRAELLGLLQQRLGDGYLHSGFPNVELTTGLDETRSVIVATIREGQRFLGGKVEVTGARTLPVDRFVDRLIHPPFDPTLPQQAPAKLWLAGKPASFSPGHWKSKHETIQKIFQNLGYHDVLFSTSVRAEPDHTATLVIAITDEGPQATLGTIEVIGCQKNTADDVIRYLDLPAAMLLDVDAKQRIEKKLADAARFLKHTVEIITPPFGDAASTLRITLVEFDEAPALTEEFSSEEQTMIRLAQWLNQFGATHDDFEGWAERNDLATPDDPTPIIRRGTVRIVLSPQERACLIHARVPEEDNREAIDFWIHVTPQTFALDAPGQSLRFEAKGLSQSVVGSLSWTANPPDAEGRISRFGFGIGIKGDSDVPLPPFILQTKMDPVAALREAHTLKDSLRFHDDLLSSESATNQLVIDCKSGRLLRWEMRDDKGKTGANFRPGRYLELLEEYQKATSQSRVITAGDYPISNLLAFLANVVPDLKSHEQSHTQAPVALAHSLLKRGAFHAFDALLLDLFNHPDDDFVLPSAETPSANAVKVGWTGMILPVARLIAPNKSWPITISREYVFARSQQGPAAGQAIHNLLINRQSGPVENLMAAYVFGMLHPQLRMEFARVGLTRLQRERFVADCEPLLNPAAPVGKLLSAIGQTLQEVDTEEVESLVAQFPLSPGDQQALSHALRRIAARKDNAPLDAIRVALDDAWESLLEPHLRAVLNGLAH